MKRVLVVNVPYETQYTGEIISVFGIWTARGKTFPKPDRKSQTSHHQNAKPRLEI